MKILVTFSNRQKKDWRYKILMYVILFCNFDFSNLKIVCYVAVCVLTATSSRKKNRWHSIWRSNIALCNQNNYTYRTTICFLNRYILIKKVTFWIINSMLYLPTLPIITLSVNFWYHDNKSMPLLVVLLKMRLFCTVLGIRAAGFKRMKSNKHCAK